jgi:hypothetical protein
MANFFGFDAALLCGLGGFIVLSAILERLARMSAGLWHL